MRREYKGKVVAGLVLAAALAAAVLVFRTGAPPLPAPPDRPQEVGSDDDPDARSRYEWMRLRDPSLGIIPPGIHERELSFARQLPVRSMPGARGLERPGALASLVRWEPRGPFNVGGRTRALAMDVSSPGVVLAGGVSGGVWRSDNNGSSWSKTTAPGQLHSVTCIAQDTRPGRTTVWYYGTGESTGNSASAGGGPYRGDGIFKSVDGGRTWTPLPSTVSGTPEFFDSHFDYIWNIALNAAGAMDEVYVAAMGGILRSTDGGATWTVVLGGTPITSERARFTDVAVTPSGVVYAALSRSTIAGTGVALDAGLWRSPDGVNWTNITPSEWPQEWRRVAIGIAPSNERRVYFLGETPGSGLQVGQHDVTEWHSLWCYEYTGGNGAGTGGTWENRSMALPSFGGNSGSFTSQRSYDLVIKVKPDNDSTVFIGGVNLYRSTDGFRTSATTALIGGYASPTTYRNYAQHHADQHALFFDPRSPAVLLSGHDGGVSLTNDCLASTVVWISLNNGYMTSQFYTVGLDQSTAGNDALIGGTQDNGTWYTASALGASPWVDVLGGDGAYCGVAVGRTSFYASAQNGEIYRLLLNEATGDLQNFTRVDPTGGTGYLFINPFVLDPNRANVMYLAGGSSLWKNSDLSVIPWGSQQTTSAGWVQLAGTTVPNSTISTLAMSREAPRDRLYYGTVDGRVFRIDDAHLATAATQPVDIWTGKGLPAGGFASCIAIDPQNGDHAVVVFSNYGIQSLYATADAGTTWTTVAGNLEQRPDGTGNGPSTRWLTILPHAGRSLYFVGTSAGLYSTDQLNGPGTIWAMEGDSLIGNVVVDMVESRALDGLVVAATHGNGVFSGAVGRGLVPPPPVLPAKTALLPNYPNPFNHSTRIVFDLAEPARVAVAIYTVNGQLVTQLLDEDRPAGARQGVVWTPLSLASGIYICRFTAGSVTEARKLVLVK